MQKHLGGPKLWSSIDKTLLGSEDGDLARAISPLWVRMSHFVLSATNSEKILISHTR